MAIKTKISDANHSRYMPFVAAGFAAGTIGAVAAFFTYRWLQPLAPTLTPHVQDNLPMAKNLKTIPDVQGNYDIDGVSFDSEGVIVSGDDNKTARPSIINPS